ncbi:hypothetical protein EDF66_104132 [Sphingobacterium sp. JUb20]|nr:hypothetical protein [Sphingobacterium sp. JUb21]TCR08027.1 hypothetical protein EDF66_104132 [Sphingobacterium sp. JUb20]
MKLNGRYLFQMHYCRSVSKTNLNGLGLYTKLWMKGGIMYY